MATENQPGSPPSVAVLSPQKWEDYELIDSGNGEKLERFGRLKLIRPEPQALWEATWPRSKWERIADGWFDPGGSHQGTWRPLADKQLPDRWVIHYPLGKQGIKLRLATTAFKHVGVFPEQAVNWEFLSRCCRGLRSPRVLNLFAYTGGATLAARSAGAQVTHVDSVRQILNWASDNATLNGFSDIRWLREDALKFVEKEVRRQNRYSGIIMDPPAFGHGPKGERWKLEHLLDNLIRQALKLLDNGPNFLLVNAYSLGLSPLILRNLLQSGLSAESDGRAKLEVGELAVPETAGGRLLPAGIYARLQQ